jgi:hypothetical protein
MHGAAAKRKIEATVYAVLTANGAMSDGLALFHASHSNYVAGGGGAAPSETTLGAAQLALRTQTGLAGELLNLESKFIIAPAALEVTIDKLLNSIAVDETDKSSGISNVFRGKLTSVISALLDQTSSTAWYLSCDPKSSIDTIEIAWLDGQSSPYLEQRSGWTVDGTEFKVRIDLGVKALDWRGLYLNAGV